MKIKYGPLFADQSKCDRAKTETKNGTSEEQNEKRGNQSHTKRTFENKHGVNKNQQNEKLHPLDFVWSGCGEYCPLCKMVKPASQTAGQSDISTLKSSCSPKEILCSNQVSKLQKLKTELPEVDRENFYHWSARDKNMKIIRRRNNTQANRAEKRVIPLENCDAGLTILHNGQYSPHPDQTKEVEQK